MCAVQGVAAIAIAFMLSGCAGAEQFSVSNQPNNFNLGGQAAGKDGTESWTWTNNFGSAQISWGGQVGDGKMMLTIEDATGQQVFTRSLSGQTQEGFDGSSQSGAAGDWTITVSFEDFTGQMGLSIRGMGGGMGGSFGGWGG